MNKVWQLAVIKKTYLLTKQVQTRPEVLQKPWFDNLSKLKRILLDFWTKIGLILEKLWNIDNVYIFNGKILI